MAMAKNIMIMVCDFIVLKILIWQKNGEFIIKKMDMRIAMK